MAKCPCGRCSKYPAGLPGAVVVRRWRPTHYKYWGTAVKDRSPAVVGSGEQPRPGHEPRFTKVQDCCCGTTVNLHAFLWRMGTSMYSGKYASTLFWKKWRKGYSRSVYSKIFQNKISNFCFKQQWSSISAADAWSLNDILLFDLCTCNSLALNVLTIWLYIGIAVPTTPRDHCKLDIIHKVFIICTTICKIVSAILYSLICLTYQNFSISFQRHFLAVLFQYLFHKISSY